MSQPASIPKLLLHHAVETPDKVAFLGPGWAVVRILLSIVCRVGRTYGPTVILGKVANSPISGRLIASSKKEPGA